MKFSNYLFDFKIRLYSQNDMCIYFGDRFTKCKTERRRRRRRCGSKGDEVEGLNDIVENVIFLKPYICSRNLWSLWFWLRELMDLRNENGAVVDAR